MTSRGNLKIKENMDGDYLTERLWMKLMTMTAVCLHQGT